MRALAVWIVGTVYVLAALVGASVIVWAADHDDNSANPTHWSVGAIVVLMPIALWGGLAIGGTPILRRVAQRRRSILVGAGLAAVVSGVLIVGGRAIVVDANACGDDDCVTLSIPLAVACVLGAWSLPLGLSMLRRWRFPAPLTSIGMVAVSITSAAGSTAAVQLALQEDNYADLGLDMVLSGWVLPAVVAAVAVLLLRDAPGAAAQRTSAGRIAAAYLAVVGSWLIAMPFVAGVDSDSLPALVAVAGAPGAVLVTLGLMASAKSLGAAASTISG